MGDKSSLCIHRFFIQLHPDTMEFPFRYDYTKTWRSPRCRLYCSHQATTWDTLLFPCSRRGVTCFRVSLVQCLNILNNSSVVVQVSQMVSSISSQPRKMFLKSVKRCARIKSSKKSASPGRHRLRSCWTKWRRILWRSLFLLPSFYISFFFFFHFVFF